MKSFQVKHFRVDFMYVAGKHSSFRGIVKIIQAIALLYFWKFLKFPTNGVFQNTTN